MLYDIAASRHVLVPMFEVNHAKKDIGLQGRHGCQGCIQQRAAADPWNPLCPSREILALIGSKWVFLILPLLRNGPRRNSDLMRQIPAISQKMLTQTLRNLQNGRLLTRKDFRELPLRVEYELTDLGHSLEKHLTALDEWVIRHCYDMIRPSENVPCNALNKRRRTSSH